MYVGCNIFYEMFIWMYAVTGKYYIITKQVFMASEVAVLERSYFA